MASPMKLLKTKQSTPLPSQFLPYQDTSCNNVAGGSTSVKREDEPATTRPKSMELTRSAHNLSYNKITGKNSSQNYYDLDVLIIIQESVLRIS